MAPVGIAKKDSSGIIRCNIMDTDCVINSAPDIV